MQYGMWIIVHRTVCCLSGDAELMFRAFVLVPLLSGLFGPKHAEVVLHILYLAKRYK